MTVQDIIASKSIAELATKVTLPKGVVKSKPAAASPVTSTPAPAVARPKPKPKAKVEVETTTEVDVPEVLRKVWSQILKLSIEEVELESSFLHLVSNTLIYSALIY